VVSTVAGGGVGTFVDGTGFNGPICLTIDASGNLLVSNLYENKIRKVTPTGGAHASIECVLPIEPFRHITRASTVTKDQPFEMISVTCIRLQLFTH
jgi:hypothetical protein